MTFFLEDKRLGFIGVGHIAKALISAFLKNRILKSEQIFIHNRTPGKAKKMVEQYKVTAFNTPEQLVESSDIVILAVKPHDLLDLLEPLRNIFTEDQVVMSLSAGIELSTLRKFITKSSLLRVLPNTPVSVGQAVVSFCAEKSNWVLEELVKKLFSPLGSVVLVEEGEEFSAMTVSAGSGTGFVFEIMQYWQDWLEEHGLAGDRTRQTVVQTFMGSACLAKEKPELSFDELALKVSSKKGVTLAGLESMRELEIERTLRMSFNKALLRDQEIARENS